MAPRKFCKRPVVIEAMRLESGSVGDVLDWVGKSMTRTAVFNGDGTVTIETLEGDMLASIGDWIIKGVQGEFYPCKPDIFDATYEAV